jgi:hypothetical protein
LTRSYYEIFGVKRTATSDEIRAAYLALIKRYHPDVAGSAGAGGADMVPLLNRCYAVLKDRRKRAAYDAQLARQTSAEQTPRSGRRAVVLHAPRAARGRSRIPLLVGAVTAVTAILLLAHGSSSESNGSDSLLTWDRAVAKPAAERPLSGHEIARVTEVATHASADEAERISSQCFNAAEQNLEAASAKLCIVFDDAFLYWRQNANEDDDLPLYFREEMTRIRHLDALGGTEDAERSLGQLRDLTFKALLSQLTQARLPAGATNASVAPRQKLEIGSVVKGSGKCDAPRCLSGAYARASR